MTAKFWQPGEKRCFLQNELAEGHWRVRYLRWAPRRFCCTRGDDGGCCRASDDFADAHAVIVANDVRIVVLSCVWFRTSMSQVRRRHSERGARCFFRKRSQYVIGMPIAW